jgi:uncharacterized protein YdaU (DUF1376 family)
MSENVVVSKDVLQQALKALESLFTLQADDVRPKRCGDAITALRAALAQQEQEITTRAKEIYTCGWQDAVKTLFTLMHELQQDPVRVHHSHHWLLNYISQHVASPNYPEAIIQRHFERSPYGAKQEQKTA